MPTLRIEADFVGTSTGFVSNYGFSSYAAALAKQAEGGPVPANAVQPLWFIRKNPDGTFDGVKIYRDDVTQVWYAMVVEDWTNPYDPSPDKITLTVANSIAPGGTRVSDINIPDDVYTAMQSCDWVYYKGNSLSGKEYFGITEVTGPNGEIYYKLGYGFFRSTVSNVRGFIEGSLLFDSSDTTPGPYDWGGTYSSTISWGGTPDIFWTNRVLCEETQS